MWAPDYPWGRTEEEYRREMERDLGLFGPRDQALNAVGQGAGRALDVGRESEDFRRLVDPAVAIAGQAVHRPQQDVVAHRHRADVAAVLECPHQAEAGPQERAQAQ